MSRSGGDRAEVGPRFLDLAGTGCCQGKLGRIALTQNPRVTPRQKYQQDQPSGFRAGLSDAHRRGKAFNHRHQLWLCPDSTGRRPPLAGTWTRWSAGLAGGECTYGALPMTTPSTSKDT